MKINRILISGLNFSVWGQSSRLRFGSLLLALSFASCVQADTLLGKTLQPVRFDQVYAAGELYQRAMKNFDRLETDIYYPENVFPKQHHRNYPINPAERVAGKGEMSGSSANVVNGWKLSTDVGCDFIFMDGVVQAYGLFPSKDVKSLIDEMMARFLEMDLVGMKAQTHATLTGLRAALRYFEITGRKDLLPEVEKRYQLYREQAMTENYENYNWFERPEWTEPCAIVDSYLVAMQLWQYTQHPVYLEDAQHIYYNAIGHTQRANGGFGCDNCPGPKENTVSVKANEAFWCCTMRGGEGLAKAVQYSYFTIGDTLLVPSFNSGSLKLKMNGSQFTLGQQTAYPFDNKVIFKIEGLAKPMTLNLKLFVPGWIQNPVLMINHKSVLFQVKKQFVVISVNVQSGDVIDYSFVMKSGIDGLANQLHTKAGDVRLFYGPLLLGYQGDVAITIPQNAAVVKDSSNEFQLKGTDYVLSPVYHLMDAKVCQGEYRKQILFKQALK